MSDADEHAAPTAPDAPEAVDIEALIRHINELAREEKVPVDWFAICEARFANVRSEALAAERGISGTAQRQQASRMFRTIAMTFPAATIAAYVLFVLTAKPVDHLVTVQVPVFVDAGVAPVPSGPPPSVLVDTQERAASVRGALMRDIRDAVGRKQWKRCMDDVAALPPDVANPGSELETTRRTCDEEYLRDMNAKSPRQ